MSGSPGLAVDSVGNLYIGDGTRLRKVTNGIITTIAGNGTPGTNGAGGPAILAQLTQIAGVALDSVGNIYVSDNGRICKISNGIITTVVGKDVYYYNADGTPINGPVYGAAQMTVDSVGSLYFADVLNNRIMKMSNGMVTTLAGSGTAGFSGDGGPAISAQLNHPYGVALDPAGNIYVADLSNHRIRKVSSGIITTIAGNGSMSSSGDDGPAAEAGVFIALRLSLDAKGNVYLAGSVDNHVRILRPAGSSCAYSVSPITVNAPAAGGSFNVSVQTTPSCGWAVFGLPDWIASSASSSGANLATVALSIAPNSGLERTTEISIAGTLARATQSSPPPVIQVGGILNAASSAAGVPIAAGSLAKPPYGQFFLDGLKTASNIPLPWSLAGLSLEFSDGLEAPPYAVTGLQANFQVPWELSRRSQASLSVVVNGQTSAAVTMNLSPFAPGIFSINGQGTGQGAILDSLYRLVDSANPAQRGSAIQIFCTGLGAVSNQPVSGASAPSEPLASTITVPTVMIGGAPAKVLFSGLTPVAVGLYQVNALVPSDSTRGAGVPVTISMGSSVSNTVTIAVQ